MRLVYMGTPDIARVCLQRLHERGFEIAAVYTKPDTPKNRGMKLAQSPVKEYALSVGLPVVQPQSFRDDAVVEELRALAPDLIVSSLACLPSSRKMSVISTASASTPGAWTTGFWTQTAG